MKVQQFACSVALLGCFVVVGCLQQIDVSDPNARRDAGLDTGPADRLRTACGAVRDRVLYACTVPRTLVYGGEEQARLAQISIYSCGVRVTVRGVQIVFGRDPFPGGSFRGLITGSRGTNYFPNMVVLDGMRGGVIRHRVIQEYDDSRLMRIEPMPITISEGDGGRHFFLAADIAEREDRSFELFGPEYRVGFSPWWGQTPTVEALDVVDSATGTPIPSVWLHEAPWSSGCLDPRDNFTITHRIGGRDAGG